MTDAQRARLRKALLTLQAELETRGFQRLDPNRTSTETAGDKEDEQPLNEMLQSVASGRNRNQAHVLEQLRAALAKLRDDPDDYGVCEECGEGIALPRLQAMPYARYCVTCQSKLDGPKSGPTRRKLTDFL